MGTSFGPGGKPFGPGGGPFGPDAPDQVQALFFPLFAVLDFPLAETASFSTGDVDDNAGLVVLDFPLASESSFSVAVVTEG